MENKITLTIDEDLLGYLDTKENLETFINFCIRERKEAEIKMSMRRVRIPSEESLEKRKIERETFTPLKPEEVKNPNTPFFQKKIVITGVFYSFPIRSELAKLLKEYGADINSCISKNTNMVIMGNSAGPKKKDKIKDLQGQGYAIEVLKEESLLSLFKEYGIPFDPAFA